MSFRHKKREYEKVRKPTSPRDIVVWGYDRTNEKWHALNVNADGKVDTTS